MGSAQETGPVGVLSGRFVPGALIVDAADHAKVSGNPAPRGFTEKRISDVDETEVTLAWDAVRHVLRDAGVRPEDVTGLFVASDDPGQTAGLLAKTLGQDRLETTTFSPSGEAAAGALVSAMEAARRTGGPVLYVAAQDTTGIGNGHATPAGAAGAAAVALLLGAQAPVESTSHAVRHHLHHAGAAPALLKDLAGDGNEAAARVAVAASSPTESKAWLRSLGERSVSYPVQRLGDLGAAAPGAALLEAMAVCEPGDALDILVPGEHRSMGLRFQVQETPRVVGPGAALAAGGLRVDGNVAQATRRAWSENAGAEPRGAYVPLPVFHAQDAARLRFEGQECASCAKLLFPPRARCPGCGGARFRTFSFSGKGTVYSITRIGTGGAPAEFAPLQKARGAYGVSVVELEEGPRVAAMLTGPKMGGEGMKIGDPVRLVVRLLYVQDGVPRYSFKALPSNAD